MKSTALMVIFHIMTLFTHIYQLKSIKKKSCCKIINEMDNDQVYSGLDWALFSKPYRLDSGRR